MEVIPLIIEKPWFHGKKVGIAKKRLRVGGIMQVQIAYKDTSGKRLFPYKYLMSCEKVSRYPWYIRKGTVLHMVPIDEFEIGE